MRIVLTVEELAALDRQDPATREDGGWQSLIVRLQRKVNRSTRELSLDPRDLERIPRYAFDYGNGGWEARLVKIFGRALGAELGRPQPAGAR
jgi:hypothetical protein